MAGHSKWANTKFRKAAQDQKRGKLFTKFIREITIAAKQGGTDPAINPRLRAAIDKALDGNLTRDAIERSIKRVAGGEEKDLEEIIYEGYAPAGIAVIVECLTDNRTRTVSNVRHAFTKHGGNLGVDGSVSYMFAKKGQIIVKPMAANQMDELMEIAINAGALDFDPQPDGICITADPKDFPAVKLAIEALKVPIEYAEIVMLADNYIKLEDTDTASKVSKFLDALEDLDDVQNVYCNADLSEFDS